MRRFCKCGAIATYVLGDGKVLQFVCDQHAPTQYFGMMHRLDKPGLLLEQIEAEYRAATPSDDGSGK